MIISFPYIASYWHVKYCIQTASKSLYFLLVHVFHDCTFVASQQDKCIVDQLSMGIRYFDLRIAHKPNDPSDTLYFTHIIYTYVTVLVSRWLWMKNTMKTNLDVWSVCYNVDLNGMLLLSHECRQRWVKLSNGWSLTLRRWWSSPADFLGAWVKNSTRHSFHHWRHYLALNSVLAR